MNEGKWSKQAKGGQSDGKSASCTGTSFTMLVHEKNTTLKAHSFNGDRWPGYIKEAVSQASIIFKHWFHSGNSSRLRLPPSSLCALKMAVASSLFSSEHDHWITLTLESACVMWTSPLVSCEANWPNLKVLSLWAVCKGKKYVGVDVLMSQGQSWRHSHWHARCRSAKQNG